MTAVEKIGRLVRVACGRLITGCACRAIAAGRVHFVRAPCSTHFVRRTSCIVDVGSASYLEPRTLYQVLRGWGQVLRQRMATIGPKADMVIVARDQQNKSARNCTDRFVNASRLLWLSSARYHHARRTETKRAAFVFANDIQVRSCSAEGDCHPRNQLPIGGPLIEPRLFAYGQPGPFS